MAVGYGDPGHKTSEGEAEMFISMAENASADSMLFISPDKLLRKSRKVLDDSGCATWDRMALAIAIGEQYLVSEKKEEKLENKGSPGDEAFDPLMVLDQFLNEEKDPLLGPSEIGPENIAKEVEPTVRPETESGARVTEEALSIQVRKVEFPDGSVKPTEGKGSQASMVSEDVLLNAWSGFDDWKKKEDGSQEKEEEGIQIIPDLPLMETIKETPPEKRPWVGATLAPTRCNREEACAKAGVPNDTELDLEHVPNLLVSVSYSLKSDDGATVSRAGEYLFDPIKSGLIDIPNALAEELRSTLSVWDGKGPAKVMDKASEENTGYIRALKDRLTRERHAEDRMVRETLMSTIYQEVRYLFDPTSFNIRWSRRVVIPFWLKKDENGNVKWMVDAYLGRYLQVGSGNSSSLSEPLIEG